MGFADGPAISAQFNSPSGVASDVGGNVFVADPRDNRIRRIDWVTRIVSTVAGNGVRAELDGIGTAAQFSYPCWLGIMNGSIWVTDDFGHTVRRIGMGLPVVFTFLSYMCIKATYFPTVLSCPVSGNILHNGSLCDASCAAAGLYSSGSNICTPCPSG